MRRYTVTLTIETDIEDEGGVARVLRDALNNAPLTPYFDYSDLEIELEEGDEG